MWIGLATIPLAMLVVIAEPATASDTTTRWEAFSESGGCGSPYTRSPFAPKVGAISDSQTILGPFGTYFGRSISQIKARLVDWPVPGSGGRQIKVHQAMLPSLRRVAANLSSHAAEGRRYAIDSVGGFTPRTIGGRYQISRHALGLAIDINPAQNPHRLDGRLITNMPDWFVEAWTSEGFCWGGDWRGAKDPMHFSWMGPGHTPDPIDRLPPLPPLTSKTALSDVVDDHPTEFGPVLDRYSLVIGDMSGNGAPDVVGLRAHPGGTVIDVASSMREYGQCSLFRWFLEDDALHASDLVAIGDLDGDSRSDVLGLKRSGTNLTATTAARSGGFTDLTTYATGMSADSIAVTLADFDSDHRADAWEITVDGRVRIWRGPEMTQLLDDSPLPGSLPLFVSAGDRDGGDHPELFALYPDGAARVFTREDSWTLETTRIVASSGGSAVAVGASDYDGDGRADLQILTGEGDLRVHVANSPNGGDPGAWFVDPDRDCGQNPLRLHFSGSFYDDDDSIFEANIESISAARVTRGCNPPFRDRFCPDDVVKRETMAAFLVRALGLRVDDHPGFRDVDPENTFAEDISILASAGITKGCNPPANDRFCPDDPVTRETMAAFLSRALALKAGQHPGFSDVPASSVFVGDIKRLAGAGITKGCNPPANDRYCPKDLVSRDTMAAFLDRAGLGS